MTFRTGLNLLAIIAVFFTGSFAFADEGTDTPLSAIAAPLTHPTVFEDPRPTTEARPIYIYHRIDDDFVTSGGAATVYALQLRYAVNDRLGIIATKDGYVDLKSDEVLDDSEGIADVAVGAKYAFYRDDENGKIATAGLRYEIPLGDEDVFQGQEDGAVNPFLSGAVALGPVNVMAGTGFRLALDDADSSFFDFDLHADTKCGPVHPLIELNVTNVVDAGARLPIPDEGEDFFNFGSSDSEGKTLVAAAIGVRTDITEKISWGVGYQIPLTDGRGSNILDYRITTDLIFRL